MCQCGANRKPHVDYRIGPLVPRLSRNRGVEKCPFKIAAKWVEIDENVKGAHLRTHWLAVWSDAMNSCTLQLLPKAQISKLRSSSICAIVQRPDHHCGDELVHIDFIFWQSSNLCYVMFMVCVYVRLPFPELLTVVVWLSHLDQTCQVNYSIIIRTAVISDKFMQILRLTAASCLFSKLTTFTIVANITYSRLLQQTSVDIANLADHILLRHLWKTIFQTVSYKSGGTR